MPDSHPLIHNEKLEPPVVEIFDSVGHICAHSSLASAFHTSRLRLLILRLLDLLAPHRLSACRISTAFLVFWVLLLVYNIGWLYDTTRFRTSICFRFRWDHYRTEGDLGLLDDTWHDRPRLDWQRICALLYTTTLMVDHRRMRMVLIGTGDDT